ncbi:MAG: hypothetical protein NWE83_10440 [Candidatus Bathyarchaeota archaeon]|nr:hypothetical protein [Candidatus Bathyarchaeota archaeon]
MMLGSGKKRTILLVTCLALIALFTISIATVLAAPKPKQPKGKGTPFTIKWVFDFRTADTGEQVITETGILHINDAILDGTVEADPSSPISGDVRAIMSGTWDWNTLGGSFTGKWIIASANGTYEGSVVGSVAVIHISGRFVGHGTNDARARVKITGSFEGTVSDYIVVLTLEGELR